MNKIKVLFGALSALCAFQSHAGLETFGKDQELLQIRVVESMEHRADKSEPFKLFSKKTIYGSVIDASDGERHPRYQVSAIDDFGYVSGLVCHRRPLSNRHDEVITESTPVGLKLDIWSNKAGELSINSNIRSLVGYKEAEYCDGVPRKIPIVAESDISSSMSILDISRKEKVMVQTQSLTEGLNFNNQGVRVGETETDRRTIEIYVSKVD